ncbi:MAG: zinc ribbon domain-containing protein [Campylobacterota bacterium]|nr:zinc ribbon domain-containing protein [Campylobacterota bacterium]
MKAFIGFWIGLFGAMISLPMLSVFVGFDLDSNWALGIAIFVGIGTAGIASEEGIIKATLNMFYIFIGLVVFVLIYNGIGNLFSFIGDFFSGSSSALSSTPTISSVGQDLVPGDTYLMKISWLLLGIVIAYVLSFIKSLARFIDNTIGDFLMVAAFPLSIYYVYSIEGVTFWSVMHMLGLIVYVFILILAIVGLEDTPDYPEEEPTPEPIKNDTYEDCVNCGETNVNNTSSLCNYCAENLYVKKENDTYEDCVNCGETNVNNTSSLCNYCAENLYVKKENDTYEDCVNCGETNVNPTNSLCIHCGKDMYKLDTNIKCSNCGSEFEDTEEACPNCGTQKR